MNWAVILAGGDGSRVRPLTRALTGDNRPKQFCPLVAGRTLLADTRARVGRYVDATQTLCVVTREHESYYRRERPDLAPDLLVEQPASRGTAAAIAYALARVRRVDKKAVVGLFPADHHYEDDGTVRRTVEWAYRAAACRPDLVFLLGTDASGPEEEYGWIEPATPLELGGAQAFTVGCFWEKPSHAVACELMARGCLWNMFVMIGSLGAFRRILYSAAPEVVYAFELVERFPSLQPAETVARIYDSLPSVDFSRHVLARRPDQIAVVRVRPVGWTDLGQPARVLSFMKTHGYSVPALGATS